MSRALLLLALGLGACGQSLTEVQKIDTIEAYEKWIAENPSSGQLTIAQLRVEELYLEKARESKALEDYDAYLAKYPEGSAAKLRDKALKEREEFLWKWADEEGSVEALSKFLEEYPRAERKRRTEAKARLKVAEYLPKLEISKVEQEPANMAEDPDGPLNGYAWHADITNNGDKTVVTLNFKLDFLTAEGRTMATKRWPLVGKKAKLPMPDEFYKPLKPGETRHWYYLDMAPDDPGWSKQVRLVPTFIQFEGEDDGEDEE